MEIKKEVLDELIKGYEKPEDLIGETGLLKQLTKALIERAMSAELTHHLGYEKHDPADLTLPRYLPPEKPSHAGRVPKIFHLLPLYFHPHPKSPHPPTNPHPYNPRI